MTGLSPQRPVARARKLAIMDFTTIQKRIWRRSKKNSSSYPIDDLTDDANVAMDRVASLIMTADGRWQFDDENQTDLPIATTNLVAGQQDYSLLTSHLDITRVEMLDQYGKWHLLKPIDQDDIHHKALSAIAVEEKQTWAYDKIANSILLYPTPTVSITAGLKVYFKRGPSYFTSSDTSKQPGFNALYHDLIVLWPVYEKLLDDDLSTAQGVFAEIQMKEAALVNDYARRSKEPLRMTARVESSR